MTHCFGSEYVLGKAKASDEEQWNLLERIYANYEEMNAQQQEIAARKRELDMELYDGNLEKIEEALHFKENRGNSREGDWDTYEKVEHIVKKFVYCRAGKAFKAGEIQEVLEERIRILSDIEQSQKERITALEIALSSVQNELAEVTRLLCMSEARVKALKTECVVNATKARQLQRVCDSLKGGSKREESDVYRDVRLLIEANKEMEKDCQMLRVALNMGPVNAKKQKIAKGVQRVRARPVVAQLASSSPKGSLEETMATMTEVRERLARKSMGAKDELKVDATNSFLEREQKGPMPFSALTAGIEKIESITPGAQPARDGVLVSIDDSFVMCDSNSLNDISFAGKPAEGTMRHMPQTNLAESFQDLGQSQLDVSVSKSIDSKVFYKLGRIQERAKTLADQVPVTDALMRAFIKCERLQEILEWEVEKNLDVRDYDACTAPCDLSFCNAGVAMSRVLSQDMLCRGEEDVSAFLRGPKAVGTSGDLFDTAGGNCGGIVSTSSATSLRSSTDKPMTVLTSSGPPAFGSLEDTARMISPLSDNLEQPSCSHTGLVFPNGLPTATGDRKDTGTSPKAVEEACKTVYEGAVLTGLADSAIAAQAIHGQLAPRHEHPLELPISNNHNAESPSVLSAHSKISVPGEDRVSECDGTELDKEAKGAGTGFSNTTRFSPGGCGASNELHPIDQGARSPYPTGGKCPVDVEEDEAGGTSSVIVVGGHLVRQNKGSSVPHAQSGRSGHQAVGGRLGSASPKERGRSSLVPSAAERRRSEKVRVKVTRSNVKADNALRALGDEVTTLRSACRDMIGEMNGLFGVMKNCVDALQKYADFGHQEVASRTEQAMSAVVEEAVKEVAEQEVMDRLEKQGITLRRHSESSRLTDEQWMQNQLYDAVVKSSHEHVEMVLMPGCRDCRGQDRGSDRERLVSTLNHKRVGAPGRREGWKQGQGHWLKEKEGLCDEREERVHVCESETPQRRLADLGKGNVSHRTYNNQGDSHGFAYPVKGDDLEDEPCSTGASSFTLWGGGEAGAWEEQLWSMRQEMWRLAGHPPASSRRGSTVPPSQPLHAHKSKDGSEGSGGRLSNWTLAGGATVRAPLEEGEGKYKPSAPYKTGPAFFLPQLKLGHSRLGPFTDASRGRGCEEILQYLRRLQPPEYSRDVTTLTPRVFRYDFRGIVSEAARDVREGVRQVKKHLKSQEFNEEFSFNILPYASAAKRLQQGGILPPWMREAVVMLRKEEGERNRKMTKLVFQKVATNIRTRNMLRHVCRGSAFAAYLVVMWEKWMGGWKRRCEELRDTRVESLRHVVDMAVNGLDVVPSQLRGWIEPHEPQWMSARMAHDGASSYHFRDAHIPPKNR